MSDLPNSLEVSFHDLALLTMWATYGAMAASGLNPPPPPPSDLNNLFEAIARIDPGEVFKPEED